MLIKTLAENTSSSEAFGCEHGLSLYIETKQHKLLFDTGASALFAKNAAKMEVDLSKVDIVVLSHGHYDHGGGLSAFLNLNHHAKVYMNHKAFGDHYANRPNYEKKYVGLDKTLLPNDRFVWVEDHLVIDDELELFSGVQGMKLNPSGNKDLFRKVDGAFEPDDFSHEQNLVIRENGNIVIIAGCAHRGIVNIIEHFIAANNLRPTHVIGGFHLYNRSADTYEEPGIISEIGSNLLHTGAMFYTCHCTGVKAYERLKTMMADKVSYLSTGSQIKI